ncbi:hypothetical protein [Catellatospora sp. NPDC049609]|uniref:hypothetical protein n=1 Tax=Catellatospora sp. NPDC049609 TaxID=3155505 RepID=UPI003447C2AD
MGDSNPDELRMLVARKPVTEPGGPVLPPQPRWQAPPVDWNDYDVPRIWDSLSCLDHEETWEQARAIARQADLLNAQADDLVRLRERLATAWSGGQSPAAAAALGRIDWLVRALRADALAAETTARGTDGVLAAMAAAKRAMEPIANKWLGVTRTDPRAWHSKADTLNERAREIMISTDAVVRDHRTNIIVPDPTEPTASPLPALQPNPDPRRPRGARIGSGGSTMSGLHVAGPSPTPNGSGVTPPGTAEPPPTDAPVEPGPVLSGLPVPGISGGTPSALPIFPGSEYARGGGAYVMPSGSVTTGYVMPMSPRPGAGGQGLGPVAGTGGMMPMPMPMGGPMAGRGADGSGNYRQSARTRWEVSQGGPAVIEPGPGTSPESAAIEPDPDEFREWFTETAMPWRLAGNSTEQAPIVTIRRGVS